jgi:hypothetical protein
MLSGMLRRKAARRTEPWYLVSPPLPPQSRTPARKSGEARSTGHSVLQLPSYLASPPPLPLPPPPPPQDEDKDIPATKNSRLDPITESIAAVTNDGIVIDLCGDSDDVEKPKPSISRRKAPRAKPSTTRRKAPRAGAWTQAEDMTLKNAVQMHSDSKNGKDWFAIMALVPGRTKGQCMSRWNDYVKHNMDVADYRRTGQWTEYEDLKLMDSIRTHGVKDWVLIATLVPGRTKKQCWDRCKKYTTRHYGAKSS